MPHLALIKCSLHLNVLPLTVCLACVKDTGCGDLRTDFQIKTPRLLNVLEGVKSNVNHRGLGSSVGQFIGTHQLLLQAPSLFADRFIGTDIWGMEKAHVSTMHGGPAAPQTSQQMGKCTGCYKI